MEPTTLRVLSSGVLAVGTTAKATSQAISANASVVRFVADVAGWLAIGAGPTATAGDGSVYLPAGIAEYFDVPAGFKASFLGISAGTLSYAVMGGK